ncbi:MAG: aldo/keto reductase, partial [Candidatus Lokiarchaeota archaeon]|nr:aldo/keto reductase [Candidatus Lokiarchaeota archaeon]MBD3340982.1 aldo/keto reductase [Candidatus Lokiarchaeota archaeon]
KDAYKSVKWALNAGYRLIDTASFYKNEKEVGKAIKDSDVPREEIFITTKVWDTEQGYDNTIEAYKNSLNRINIDYLDLYLIHWPRKKRKETWEAMQDLYREGDIKAIGVANFAIQHLKEFLKNFDVVPTVNQVEFSPFLYQTELLEYCRKNKIKLEAYSPLTHGRKLNHPTLRNIAEKYDKSTAQILIRWGLQHRLIEIPKSSNKDHIYQNADVFDFELVEKDMQSLDSLDESFRLLDDTSKWK